MQDTITTLLVRQYLPEWAGETTYIIPTENNNMSAKRLLRDI
jgi:hypothetical protein